MTRCPSCGASVPAGETICLECGTELVFTAFAADSTDAADEPPASGTASNVLRDLEVSDAGEGLPDGGEHGALSDPAQAPFEHAGAAEPEADGALAATAEAADTRAASDAPPKITCPDCLETVHPDANRMCPVCGHDFDSPIEIDEDEFFREPPSLDEVARRSPLDTIRSPRASGAPAPLSSISGDDRTGVRRGDVGASPSHRVASPPRSPVAASDTGARAPLPGDRNRRRYQVASGEHHSVQEIPMLLVEGGQSVFFEGKMATRIRLDVDQLLIGRRDPPNGHYPDIDLAHFRHIDEFISRRHARFVRRGSDWVIEDICGNDATFLNDRAHVLNGESVILKDGDRVLISDSVALTFTLYDPT